MTKQAFLETYRYMLMTQYDWPLKDAAKFDAFMDQVKATLEGANTWNHDSPVVAAAWKKLGGKGKPTKKALRNLA